jgi:hypothetical protein
VEIIALAMNRDWLHKATKEISKYWRHKRDRHQILGSHAGQNSGEPLATVAG